MVFGGGGSVAVIVAVEFCIWVVGAEVTLCVAVVRAPPPVITGRSPRSSVPIVERALIDQLHFHFNGEATLGALGAVVEGN